jgi:hypothetical protein
MSLADSLVCGLHPPVVPEHPAPPWPLSAWRMRRTPSQLRPVANRSNGPGNFHPRAVSPSKISLTKFTLDQLPWTASGWHSTSKGTHIREVSLLQHKRAFFSDPLRCLFFGMGSRHLKRSSGASNSDAVLSRQVGSRGEGNARCQR